MASGIPTECTGNKMILALQGVRPGDPLGSVPTLQFHERQRQGQKVALDPLEVVIEVAVALNYYIYMELSQTAQVPYLHWMILPHQSCPYMPSALCFLSKDGMLNNCNLPLQTHTGYGC